jgi:hypothetical protein
MERARSVARWRSFCAPVEISWKTDALARVEAVHLGQQLVQRLLALLMCAERRRDPHLAEGVEFVDEDDARS